jgi:hypothetical protein
MKYWESRFFELNRTNEVELVKVPLDHVSRALSVLGWSKDDELWAPDLHVSRFLREDAEIFVLQETYFDPKLTGDARHICEIREYISGIGPNEILYAGG